MARVEIGAEAGPPRRCTVAWVDRAVDPSERAHENRFGRAGAVRSIAEHTEQLAASLGGGDDGREITGALRPRRPRVVASPYFRVLDDVDDAPVVQIDGHVLDGTARVRGELLEGLTPGSPQPDVRRERRVHNVGMVDTVLSRPVRDADPIARLPARVREDRRHRGTTVDRLVDADRGEQQT